MDKVAGLLAFLLPACAMGAFPEEHCETKCGISSVYRPDGWTCQTVQDVEDAVMTELKKLVHVDPRFQSCEQLGSYSMYSMDEREWVDDWGRRVAGLTDCRPGYTSIVVGNAPAHENSLAHEIVHAMQWCLPVSHLEYDKDGDLDPHSGWWETGIYSAIFNAEIKLEGKF